LTSFNPHDENKIILKIDQKYCLALFVTDRRKEKKFRKFGVLFGVNRYKSNLGYYLE